MYESFGSMSTRTNLKATAVKVSVKSTPWRDEMSAGWTVHAVMHIVASTPITTTTFDRYCSILLVGPF